MMKKLKESKGITLIALIVTIIVLLILAGVAVTMLSGENGILNQGAKAKKETEKAKTDEAVKLAVMSAITAGNGKIQGQDAYDALNNGLDDAGYTGTDLKEGDLPVIITIDGNDYIIEGNGTIREPSEVEKLKASKTKVNEKTTLIDANGKTVVIPAEFKIAEDSALLVKDGIVVVAPDQSEFVWVPVENINSMVMCQGSTGANDCKITKSGEELVCTTHSQDICGKLYATTVGESFDSTLTTQKYSLEVNVAREPAVLPGDYATGDSTKGIELIKSIIGLTGTDDEIKTEWQTQLQEEYEKMAKSVYENKGFYIGRYETSLDNSKNAQSIANKPSATASNMSANTWYGLYQIDKEYSNKEYETGKTLKNIVGSTMIWGSQYDQMLLWIEKNGYNVKSTDPKDLKGAIKNTNYKTTGVEDKDILNNIYDLLGCKHEWTLAAIGDSSRVFRGTYYSDSSNHSPSFVGNYGAYVPDSSFSARITLYLK